MVRVILCSVLLFYFVVLCCCVVLGWVGLGWVGLGWVGLGWVVLCCVVLCCVVLCCVVLCCVVLCCVVLCCVVLCCVVPKALLPEGNGRDVYPRIQVNGWGCVCCVRCVLVCCCIAGPVHTRTWPALLCRRLCAVTQGHSASCVAMGWTKGGGYFSGPCWACVNTTQEGVGGVLSTSVLAGRVNTPNAHCPPPPAPGVLQALQSWSTMVILIRLQNEHCIPKLRHVF